MPALVPADGGHVALLGAGQGPLVLQVRRVAGRGVHDILEGRSAAVRGAEPDGKTLRKPAAQSRQRQREDDRKVSR